MTAPATTTAVDETTIPRLAKGIRLRADAVDGPVLLGPERIVALDDIAMAIVSRIDGTRSTADIVQELAEDFRAPIPTIRDDVLALIADLQDKGLVRW